MNISFPKILNVSALTPTNKNRNTPQLAFRGSSCDSFQLSNEMREYLNALGIFDSQRKVGPKEYEKFTPEQIKSFFHFYNAVDDIRDVANDNLDVGLSLKKFLDEKYGQDKYVFVSVGTSPAPIGRVMEFSGVETKYLPITGLKNAESSKEIVSQRGFSKYVEFLKEQGIDRDSIKNSDKTYIFYDYVSTGKSLRIFKDLMMNHLDLPNQKVEFRKLNDDILSLKEEIRQQHPDAITDPELLSEFNIKDPSFANFYVGHYLKSSFAAFYGGVDHLCFLDFSKIQDVKNYEDDRAKLYNLMLMDELNKKGLLKYNPKNAKSL